MALQTSDAVAQGRLDAVETVIGTAPYLDIRSGAQPANCAAADAGTELVHMALPSDWLAAASGRTKALAGTWSGTGAAAGTAGHFRIKNNADTVCHMQGSVTATGGGGDLELNNTSIAVGQDVDILTFTLTEPNE